MTTKQALDNAMQFAAAHTNRLHALAAFAAALPADEFTRLAGQHPDTIKRDTDNAHQNFERIKREYEVHCQTIGEPAYATYNED